MRRFRSLNPELNYKTGYGTDPALFVGGFQDANKKYVYFCLLLTAGTFTSVFTEKKLLRSHKTVEIKIFLIFYA